MKAAANPTMKEKPCRGCLQNQQEHSADLTSCPLIPQRLEIKEPVALRALRFGEDILLPLIVPDR